VSFTWVFCLDQFEDHFAIHSLATLSYNSIANLTNQY
jgi:hypothetical protein